MVRSRNRLEPLQDVPLSISVVTGKERERLQAQDLGGQKGPPVVTLTQTADGVWSVPAGSTLTDEQLASYKAGNLYVNVHTAENKGGEIRGQIKP